MGVEDTTEDDDNSTKMHIAQDTPDFRFVLMLVRFILLSGVCYMAYTIRLFAVINYGRVIHEFDPWFNFRATQYLANHGFYKFITWFDTKSWYPIGRPVGTTIYPGMQVTAVFIFRMLGWLGYDVSLNDVCVFIPAGFSVLTCLFIYGMASEISGSGNVGIAAAAIMSIIPAHLMRSVAGGYDNESVAVAAICCTFYFWLRSLRTPKSWWIGGAAGIAYFYMVATWGGYVFVVNIIGLHAALLVIVGRFSAHLHRAYSLWYIVGTSGALLVPVVGWAPLKSMEQLGPMLVFLILQLIEGLRIFWTFKKMSPNKFQYLLYFFSGIGVAIVVGVYQYRMQIWTKYEQLVDSGYVWDMSVRIKSLFIEHTKTGNPLVDSVAEHSATPSSVYDQYIHNVMNTIPYGMLICIVSVVLPRFLCGSNDRTDAKWFLIIYCLVSGYFSHKMIRLMLILAPAASITSAVALVSPLNWSFTLLTKRRKYIVVRIIAGLLGLLTIMLMFSVIFMKIPTKKKGFKLDKYGIDLEFPRPYNPYYAPLRYRRMIISKKGKFKPRFLKTSRPMQFYAHCIQMADRLSEPQIMLRGRDQKGKSQIIDDFREAYWWLRDNTPEDSRVLSWWDYGYQINGLANRTTIADGNTWNHEHIALLGKSLVSNEKQGHRIIRHLADYVLIWTTRYAGMRGDDIAKSPHMARISGSVFSDIDPSAFGIDHLGHPTPMMRESVLWKLHHYRLNPQMGVDKLHYFKEAYTTTRNMVRIYKVLRVSKESKEWNERNPDGSGTYPPKIQKIFKNAVDFSEIKRRERLKQGKFD